MYWKHGLALVAMVAVTLSAAALKAQQREDDQSRAAAAAGAQQAGAQDRDNAQRAGAQDRTGAQQRTGAQGQAGAQRQFGAQGQAGAQGEAGRQGRGQMFEQNIAFMLALGNQEEVQLGQLASQKAQNPQVKEFAQRMVQEHTQYLQHLAQFLPPGQAEQFRTNSSSTGAAAAGAGQERSTTSASTQERTTQERAAGQNRSTERRGNDANRSDNDRSDNNQSAASQQTERRSAQTRQTDGAAGQAEQTESRAFAQGGQRQGGQGNMMMISFERDAAQRCLQMTREMLNEHQGSDFDMAYIGQQIVAHTQMLAKLESAQNRVSPEFQEVIRKGVQSTNQHLKEARTISQSLASNQGQQRGQGQRGQQPGAGARGAGQANPANPGAEPQP
jgi:predicted outer membrane protein